MDYFAVLENGRFYNESFKLNVQTQTGKYGSDFKPILRLGDFINLETGEHIM